MSTVTVCVVCRGSRSGTSATISASTTLTLWRLRSRSHHATWRTASSLIRCGLILLSFHHLPRALAFYDHATNSPDVLPAVVLTRKDVRTFFALQAIDLIDEAGSRARIEAYMARVTTGGNAPPQRQPWQELAQVMQAKTEAVKVRSMLAWYSPSSVF